jgi:cytochrome c biogenesis protein CcmG/thiol:disulfide interchange protein DsbE
VNEGCRESVSLSPGDLSDPHTSGPNERIVITERMTKARSLSIALLALALAALVASGCGSSQGGDYGGKHPDYATALAGSPAPLAALHAQGNQLLPGGRGAYEKRIASLRGYPIVANVWASWCGPCRFEFASLQKLSARYGKRVAFIGVNSEDSDDTAKAFLEEAPVPYPSYSDPDKDIASSIGATGFPDTAFYDRSGALVHLKIGQYASDSDLMADIRRYALESG